jgi:hemolysin III
MKKTTLGELIANAVSHGIGAALAIAMLVILVVLAGDLAEALSALAFGVAMVALYLASTLYHSFPERMRRVSTVFQRLDHSSIFVLIAGTYTPFIVLAARSQKGYILLGVLWAITILGIVMKSIWIDRFHVLHVILYVIMGWSVLFVWNDIQPNLGNSLWLLLAGGISYTVGVAFYASRFRYAHFIWHLFVLGGSITHFLAVTFIITQ